MRFLFYFFLFITLSACGNQTKGHSKETNMPQHDIFKLVEKNEIEAVRKAIKEGLNVNTQDSNKRSLLLIATKNQQLEMTKLLVGNGANVNQQDDRLDSPFLYAGASGQTELVKLYLANGARFDIFNRYNGTALIPACERGHIEKKY